jgi:hypothetical protein
MEQRQSTLGHCRVSDLSGRLSLTSASTDRLVIQPTRRSSVGPRSFAVTGPSVLNSLLADITTIDSLLVFRRHLKKLFISFIVSWLSCSITFSFPFAA